MAKLLLRSRFSGPQSSSSLAVFPHSTLLGDETQRVEEDALSASEEVSSLARPLFRRRISNLLVWRAGKVKDAPRAELRRQSFPLLKSSIANKTDEIQNPSPRILEDPLVQGTDHGRPNRMALR